MKLNPLRSLLYRLASLLGDANAIAKGRIVQRVVRKQATKAALRGLASLFRRSRTISASRSACLAGTNGIRANKNLRIASFGAAAISGP
jgi:hypothetical protein